MEVRSFFKAAGRLAVAIFLALVALAAVIAGYQKVMAYFDEKKAEPYRIVRDWEADLVVLQLEGTAKTKLLNGTAYMEFQLHGYPPYLQDPQLKMRNRNNGFWFEFSDSDGFTVFKKFVALSEFTTRLNQAGKPAAHAIQLEEFVGVEKYARFDAFRVRWTIETELPQPTAPVLDFKPEAKPKVKPTPAVGGNGDHCEPGLARAERLRRLAQFGQVRETGMNDYAAGGKSLMLGYDGKVIYCN